MQKKLIDARQITPTPPRFVTETDLQEMTGINRRTWQKHRLFGRGPKYYKIGGAVRYNLAEVLAWIESGAMGGKSSLPPVASNLR
jgi:predicted DNA-binding transcriptional regulator AlpA